MSGYRRRGPKEIVTPVLEIELAAVKLAIAGVAEALLALEDKVDNLEKRSLSGWS